MQSSKKCCAISSDVIRHSHNEIKVYNVHLWKLLKCSCIILATCSDFDQTNRLDTQCVLHWLNSYDIITKTCQYNFDPLKPHFYIVKLGFTLFFLFCY